MNRETRLNRPKRLRIARSSTGIAQPQLSRKNWPYSLAPIPNDSYLNWRKLSLDKTPKVQRIGNYWHNVPNHSANGIAYRVLKPFDKLKVA